jgi:cation-transporting ATPase I
VAVAAVPEGLPLVALVSQLAAARRLSRRKVLVRNSRTLGTLGRVDTLCFDKTGTLTEGKLHVTKLSAPYGRTDPGEVLLRTAARAGPQTRAGLTHATDRAVAGAADALLGPDSGWRLRKEMQFEASRGYSAAIGEVDGQLELAVKGAPEIVLSRCGHVLNGTSGVRPMTAQNHRAARATVRRLTGMGLRVLAVALAKPAPDQLPDLADQDVDLMLVGFVSMADTPRPEAPGAIKHLTEAGVSVAMITGDHPGTASAIAADLGIPDADRVLTGHDLDRLSDRDRAEQIAHTTVFARVGPEHKVQIVEGLQRAGHTVSMTGDGANDAAAIRLADVGIGVTSGDSHAAPAAADLVLPGADLPAILEALAEGRSLWESVSNAVSILVGGNAGEVAFTIYGTAVGGRAPLATRQLLLVNTLTDMMPALAVALAPPQHEGMPARTTLSSAIALRGVVTAFGAILAWQIGRLTGLRARRASTMGLAALVLTQLAQTLQMGERTWSILLTAILSAVILAAIIETPGISRFFGCTPLGPAAWGIVIASVTSAIVLSTFARTHPKITNLINRIATPAALPTTTG